MTAQVQVLISAFSFLLTCWRWNILVSPLQKNISFRRVRTIETDHRCQLVWTCTWPLTCLKQIWAWNWNFLQEVQLRKPLELLMMFRPLTAPQPQTKPSSTIVASQSTNPMALKTCKVWWNYVKDWTSCDFRFPHYELRQESQVSRIAANPGSQLWMCIVTVMLLWCSFTIVYPLSQMNINIAWNKSTT